MALLYDLYLSPNSRGTNRKRYHARPSNNNSVGIEKLLKEAAERSVYSKDQLKTVLVTVLDVVQRHLTEGEHVQIPGLGGFQVSLSCPETRTPQSTRSGSVTVKSISYRPDKKLVKEIRENAKIQKSKTKIHSFRDGEMDAILQHLDIFFQSNRYLTRRDMETHCFLTRSTATRKLNQLVEMGVLVNVSRDRMHPLYEKSHPTSPKGGESITAK